MSGLGVALPPATTGWMVITACQAVGPVSAFLAERKDPQAYSKFATESQAGKKLGRMIPSRVAMFILYTPALLYAAWRIANGAGGGAAGAVTWMLLAHFAKRDAEVLFLHKYSGGMPAGQSAMIGFFYLLITALVDAAARTAPAADVSPLGTALFAIGQAGNLWHHWLLAGLRRGDGKGDGGGRAASAGADVHRTPASSVSPYKVPQGGLFEYVASPHYLFELVAWYGVAATARQLNVLLACFTMTGYLFARAANTTQWYRKKIPGYPLSRCNIVPFIY